MAKAAEAFRTISEVAEELDIPKHVLRFWEGKFTHIRPMKRGGGRRYYRPEDLELLKGIKQLLHGQGFTIRGVQKILREQGVEQVKLIVRSQLAAAGSAAAGSETGESAAVAKPRRGPKAVRQAVPAPLTDEQCQRIRAVIRELEGLRAALRGGSGGQGDEPAAERSRAASA